MARPSKYTPERVERIVNALSAGATRRAAAAYGGIDQDTFSNWMRRYSDFSVKVTDAEAKAEIAMITSIATAANKGDWHAALTWLERRRPQEWARQDGIDMLEIVRQMARQNGYSDEETQEAVLEVERMLYAARRGSRSP